MNTFFFGGDEGEGMMKLWIFWGGYCKTGLFFGIYFLTF